MYAITAASGQLGRLAVAAILERVPADQVVAVVRDPSKAQDLGVAVRHGDYDRPETLRAALAGVDRVLLISSNDFEHRVQQHRNVIAAAEEAGVSLLAYTGLIQCDRWSLPFADGHKATEADLAALSVPTVVLRNGWYWENHTQALPGAVAAGALAGTIGEGRVSWASRKDLAEGAVAVLTGEGHAGRIYELAGDGSHTLSDMAAEVSAQTGRTIPYRHLPEPEYAGMLQQFAGLPESFARLMAQTEAQGLGAHLTEHDSRTLSQLIGRPTTTLAEAVGDALADRR